MFLQGGTDNVSAMVSVFMAFMISSSSSSTSTKQPLLSRSLPYNILPDFIWFSLRWISQQCFSSAQQFRQQTLLQDATQKKK
jgi:hypothetical protein